MKWILLLIITAGTVMAAKLPFMVFIDIEGNKTGVSSLPAGLYSIRGVIKDTPMDAQISGSGEADMDFVNTLTNGKLSKRTDQIQHNMRIYTVADIKCSINPDFSAAVITRPDNSQLCHTNTAEYGIVFRLYDLENNVNYLGEKAIKKGMTECFTVEPDHQYLYDIFYCDLAECHCTLFENAYCQENEGRLQMMRTRDCSPDNCDLENLWVDWVDLYADNCDNAAKKYCHENDGGKDYTHFGSTILTDSYDDVCLTDTKLREYYCDGNKIVYEDHICLENQECQNGKCIEKVSVNKGCGLQNGKIRNHGHQWCDTTMLKECNNGVVSIEHVNNECSLPTCDYAGTIFNKGERMCMSDGETIAICSFPDTASKFTYERCNEGYECKPNTRETECNPIAVEKPKRKSIFSVWDFIKKLIQR